MPRKFQGLLGLWSYPIINLLLSFIGGGEVHNVEVWEWTDSTGRKRELTVHRRVE